MKNRQIIYDIKTVLFGIVLLLLGSELAVAQVYDQFTPRRSNKAPAHHKKVGSNGDIYRLKGDFTMIGNTNLTTSSLINSLNNHTEGNTTNNGTMSFVDIDNDPSTINSSSAYLALPTSCSEIVYAGLYWSGRMYNSSSSNQTKEFITNQQGTSTSIIDINHAHGGTNNLDATTVVINPTGATNNRYTVQNVRIGNKDFEFTIFNDGSVQKRERTNNGTWSGYTAVGVNRVPSLQNNILDPNVISETPLSQEQITSQGNYSWRDPISTGTNSQMRYRAQNVTSVQSWSQVVDVVNRLEGYIDYTLNSPISYTHNSQVYVIKSLRTFHREDKVARQTRQIQRIKTGERRNASQTRTRNFWGWPEWTNWSSETNINPIQYEWFNTTEQVNNSNVTSTNTIYNATDAEFRTVTNNYVTITGPKTTTYSGSNRNHLLDKLNIKIKKQGQPYVNITPTAQNRWDMKSSLDDIRFTYPTGNAHNNVREGNMYAAYVDVTNYVREYGEGHYFIGDVATSSGNGGDIGYYGGWGMVIIYADNTVSWKDISVFDGYAYVESGNIYHDLTISGFEAAKDGDVNVSIGMMAGEGDRGIGGDYFRVQRNVLVNSNENNIDNWVGLTNGSDTQGGFFNSTVSTNIHNDSSINSNPLIRNKTGIDIKRITIDNQADGENYIIGNLDTSAKFRYGSTQDTYTIFNMVFAVDAYVPDVESFNQITAINEGTANEILNPTPTQIANLQPGDEVSFSMQVYNYGIDPMIDSSMEIVVPYTMQLMPGSTMIENTGTSGSTATYDFQNPVWVNPVTNTEVGILNNTNNVNDFGGKIRWVLGSIPTQLQPAVNEPRIPLGVLNYKLKVTEDCLVLMSSEDDCSLRPEVDGNVTGTGVYSGEQFEIKLVSGYDAACGGEAIFGPVTLGVNPSNDFIADCAQSLAPQSLLINRYCGMDLSINTQEIVSQYPEGTVFYQTIPSVENPVVFDPDVDQFIVNDDYSIRYYYAILPGNRSTCYLNIRTKLNQINNVPAVNNVITCKTVPFQISFSEATPSLLEIKYFRTNGSSSDGEPVYEEISLANVLSNYTTVGIYTYYVAYAVIGSSVDCIGEKIPFTITVNDSTINELSDDTVNVCSRKSYVYVPNFNNIPTTALVKWYYVDTQNQRHEYNNLWNNIEINNGELHIYNASLSMNAKKLILVYQDLQTCSLYEKEITIGIENCPIIGNPNIVSPKRY